MENKEKWIERIIRESKESWKAILQLREANPLYFENILSLMENKGIYDRGWGKGHRRGVIDTLIICHQLLKEGKPLPEIPQESGRKGKPLSSEEAARKMLLKGQADQRRAEAFLKEVEKKKLEEKESLENLKEDILPEGIKSDLI